MKRKLQVPSFKLQRNIKERSRGPEYPSADDTSWAVHEPDGPQPSGHPFDLEERTARFGEAIVRFSKTIPRGPTNDRLIDQIVGCGTSVGANYCEANEGFSKKDFHFTIGRCRKEAKESKHFFRMIAASEPSLAPAARALYREAAELHLIFCSMFRKTA